jgi:hypothetical protein
VEYVKWFEEWIKAEGSVILGAPWTFGIAAMVILLAVGRFYAWFYEGRLSSQKHTIDNQKNTIENMANSHAANMKVEERHRALLQEENRTLRQGLEQAKTSNVPVAPLALGNPTVLAAAAEIKQGAVTFYGEPERWTPEQIEKFAAFSYLKDVGLADVVNTTSPSTSTVTSTPTLAQIDLDDFTKT